MKLLFLCKRRPMGRDLFTSPYGRFYYLPRLLAGKGHEVTILLCSYKQEPEESVVCNNSGIHWHSVSPLNGNPLPYYSKALQCVREIRPDWLLGFSDTYYGILAQYLARRFGCRSLIDAYDNYESYMSWCKPLHYLWRRALARADLVTAAGPHLAGLMGQKRFDKPTMVLPMAADPIGFKPLDKIKCRQELGLPSDKKLIGYCGSIHPSRGMNVLFDAYKILLRENKDVELVLTGRKGSGVSIPDGARKLGYLPDKQMPGLLNSMDVLTVINKSSIFGNFSYPVKLYEAMCCQVPVIATATPATEWILGKHRELLVPPGSSIALSRKITRILQKSSGIDYGKKEGWEKESVLFEQAMINYP
jgi:glycosyltransferase involved in cell wall biosynthesis